MFIGRIKTCVLFYVAPAVLALFVSFTAVAQGNPADVRPTILRIVSKLQKDNIVHFGYLVGYGLIPETGYRYYRLYNRLKAKATNAELVHLTNSSSEVVRIYAFKILHLRDYNGLKTILKEHTNDTTWFWTASGCTGVIDRVNWYMLRQLKPGKENTVSTQLTENEYLLYCERFKTEDSFFSSD